MTPGPCDLTGAFCLKRRSEPGSSLSCILTLEFPRDRYPIDPALVPRTAIAPASPLLIRTRQEKRKRPFICNLEVLCASMDP